MYRINMTTKQEKPKGIIQDVIIPLQPVAEEVVKTVVEDMKDPEELKKILSCFGDILDFIKKHCCCCCSKEK